MSNSSCHTVLIFGFRWHATLKIRTHAATSPKRSLWDCMEMALKASAFCLQLDKNMSPIWSWWAHWYAMGSQENRNLNYCFSNFRCAHPAAPSTTGSCNQAATIRSLLWPRQIYRSSQAHIAAPLRMAHRGCQWSTRITVKMKPGWNVWKLWHGRSTAWVLWMTINFQYSHLGILQIPAIQMLVDRCIFLKIWWNS